MNDPLAIIDHTIPDDATIQRMVNSAVARAQRILVELSEAGRIPFGAVVHVAVRWPNQHKGEHFLFASTNGEDISAVHPLSERAVSRLQQTGGAGDKFFKWVGIQSWHEQLRFQINTNLRLEGVNHASGLILPNR